jgi:hypothetical protein
MIKKNFNFRDFYLADSGSEQERSECVFKEMICDSYNLHLLEGERIQSAIDLGCNVGIVSRLMCLNFSGLSVRGFDFDKSLEPIFLKNAEGLDSIAHWTGVFGELDVAEAKRTWPNSEHISPIEMWSIAGFDRVDLLKIDIEGYEAHVIEELSEAGIIPKLSWIVGEWHFQKAKCVVETILPETHTVYIRNRPDKWVNGEVHHDDFFACPKTRLYDSFFTAEQHWSKL